MNKAFFTLPIASLFLMGPASANQLDLSQVADDANWVMHMDFDASRSSKIGSFILDKIEGNEEAVERIEKMKTTFGVDMKGFSSLTMFGNGEHKKGIAILTGGLNVKKLIDFAELNESLQTSRVGRHEIHSFNKDKRHPMAFAALKGNVIVGGPDADFVSRGINLVKGKAASREPIGLLGELRQIIAKPGFIAYLDVAKAAKFHDLKEGEAAMVEKIDSAGVVAGETDGELKMAAILKTADEETAKQVEDMVRGMLAMAALSKESDPRLAKILESQSVKRDGNSVNVQIGLSIDAIKEGIEREMDKNI
ncbi:MAG: hypothetical protein CMI32_07715 [Opitutales bacterium]|jgi:hypothetical protein|nr:hypothetical protein [Opitutales bacterium]|tara:strand:+ start:128 stop:1051 length:924 start_codon:yes stop_codon:yes gene_type:complete